MLPPVSRLLGRSSNCAAICLTVACSGLWGGCSSAPVTTPDRDQEPRNVFQQLAALEVSSDRLYQAVVEQADAVGYSRHLEMQSDLANPLQPADFTRIKQSFEGSLKVMLFDLAPTNFWEQHLAEYYTGTLPVDEAQTLVDDYEHQVLKSSSRVQGLRQSFVTDRLPNLLPVVRARSQSFEISNVTMVPTLLPGDQVILNRSAYQAVAPQRGDVVLYRYPDEEGKLFVHRVVGLPGDRIEIHRQVLSVNNEPVSEPYTQHTDPPMERGNVRDHLGPMIVPPDSYFLLGDNREESVDSRFLGTISRASILGQIVFLYWSVDPHTRLPRWERLNQPVH
ncbi:MAG: signal peptidase I [Nitrospira sp. WS110]|nr:signal peptidase I [Nitrospira sp. WS110]